MDVHIAGKLVHLGQQQVIGTGGEGTVFLTAPGNLAVKIYHQPTSQREEKLRAFLARRWHLSRERVALPLQAVQDPGQSKIIGFTMPYMGARFQEIARLANKKHRTTFLISTQDVARVFLNGAETLTAIHQDGLVVGDFNDQNVLYKDGQMLWIDVDAWQFSSYPCPVGTEDFLVPELYNIDLSQRPVFKPEYDWYAFAVHLFRSLLLAHPYGGTHKQVTTLTERTVQKIFVLDPNVTYPKIAYTPDLLSDDLADIFERIFARGWRGAFPVEVLNWYYDSLVECGTCKMYYPGSRQTCPICQAKTLVVIQQPVKTSAGVRVTELIRARGKIVFTKVQGPTVSVLAYEDGLAVLYTGKVGIPTRRRELFKEMPGAIYDLLGDVLIINPPHTRQLWFINMADEQLQPLFQGETALFASSRRAIFQTSQTYLFSIVNHALLSSIIEGGALSSRVLRTVMENQTWFTVASETDDGKLCVFGFFQVFYQQLYWYMRGHAVYDVALVPLNDTESLLNLAVHFSNQGALIRRHTQEQGIDYLRTELIDTQGNVVYTGVRRKRADHPCPHLHGQAYATGVLLHATDHGIVQERVEQGTFKTFSATQDYVQEGDTLERFQSGLLVIGEDVVRYIVM